MKKAFRKNKKAKTLFEMKDNSGAIISKTIDYNDSNDESFLK